MIEKIKGKKELDFDVLYKLPFGVFIFKLKSGKLYFVGASKEADKISGINHKKLVGKTFEQSFPSLAETKLPAIYKKIAQRGGSFSENQFNYEDEKIKGVYKIFAFQYLRGVVAVNFWDITKEAQAEEMYSTIINETGQIIYDYDIKTGKIKWAGATESILGYPLKEFQKTNIKKWESYINPADRSGVLAILEKSQKSGSNFSAEYRFKSKSRKYIYISDRGAFLKNNKGFVYRMIGTMSDISTRKIAEMKLTEEAFLKSKFLQVMSHQILTPTSAMRWNIESLLEEGAGGTKSSNDRLKAVHDSMLTLISHVGDLLAVIDLKKGRSLVFNEKVQVSDIFKPLITAMASKCKAKKITFKYDSKIKGGLTINADPEKIKRAAGNILENALSFTEAKGKINATLKKEGNYLHFETADSGLGIGEADKKYIFTPFFRASTAFKATQNSSGVGLAIAKYYIEQHGGKIGFRSEEGQGSTFWFKLPIHKK